MAKLIILSQISLGKLFHKHSAYIEKAHEEITDFANGTTNLKYDDDLKNKFRNRFSQK